MKAGMHTSGLLALIALAAMLFSSMAQAKAMNQETGEAILEELQAIRALLERIEQSAAPSTVATVITKARPALGDKNAPVTLVEFTDYQCPFCARFMRDTYPQLKEDYIDTGKVRLVVKDLPLAMHANARKAAQAAHCAGEQDAFWPMHEKLFEHSQQLEAGRLPGYAAEIGLDAGDFAACLASDRHLADIDGDSSEAARNGITGTPTFVLAAGTGDRVRGEKIRGAQPFASFKTQIDALLAKQTKK